MYCWIAVPFAVPALRASRHLPLFLFTTVCQAVGEIGPPGVAVSVSES
jgi:hypothetical protein